MQPEEVIIFVTRCGSRRMELFGGTAQAGAPPEVLKELLGHSTLAMVLRYAHITDDRLELAIEGVHSRLCTDKYHPLQKHHHASTLETTKIANNAVSA